VNDDDTENYQFQAMRESKRASETMYELTAVGEDAEIELRVPYVWS
jgi:hypothetical protein